MREYRLGTMRALMVTSGSRPLRIDHKGFSGSWEGTLIKSAKSGVSIVR
jgi:hypothetical protein